MSISYWLGKMEITPSLDTHTLIQEYRRALSGPKHYLPLDSQAVVMLSGPSDIDSNGNIIREESLENVARIVFAVELIRRNAAKSESPSEEPYLKNCPPLVLNGLTEQLPMLERIALESGIPQEMIKLVDCGKRGIGNTKTQCEAMRTDQRFIDCKHITFVTTGYHVPRVARTAEKQLPNDVYYSVISVPYKYFAFNKFIIRSETKKIREYLLKGDIAEIASRCGEYLIQ
jgi:uncharacterized SAM-binding protein YcdF (DUF218 family)